MKTLGNLCYYLIQNVLVEDIFVKDGCVRDFIPIMVLCVPDKELTEEISDALEVSVQNKLWNRVIERLGIWCHKFEVTSSSKV